MARETISDWLPRIYGNVAYALITNKDNPYTITINRSIVSNKGSHSRAIRELKKAGILIKYKGYVTRYLNFRGYISYHNKENFEQWEVSKERFTEDAPSYAEQYKFKTSGSKWGYQKKKIPTIEDSYEYLSHINAKGYIHIYFNLKDYDIKDIEEIRGKYKTTHVYKKVYPKALIPQCAKDIYCSCIEDVYTEKFDFLITEVTDLKLKSIGKKFYFWDYRPLEELNTYSDEIWNEKKVDKNIALAQQMKIFAEGFIEDLKNLKNIARDQGGWSDFKIKAIKHFQESLTEDAALYAVDDTNEKLQTIGKMALAGWHEGVTKEVS